VIDSVNRAQIIDDAWNLARYVYFYDLSFACNQPILKRWTGFGWEKMLFKQSKIVEVEF
jgi:hypothetical protein